MEENRPLGVSFFSGLFTVIGAIAAMLLFFEILDYLRISGIKSISINSLTSFLGFVLYGGIPVLYYVTGVGLSLSRMWARKSAILYIPVMTAFLALNVSFNIAKSVHFGYTSNILEIVFGHLDIFFKFLIIYLLLNIPPIIYFKKSTIFSYFIKASQIQ